MNELIFYTVPIALTDDYLSWYTNTDVIFCTQEHDKGIISRTWNGLFSSLLGGVDRDADVPTAAPLLLPAAIFLGSEL